MSDRDVAVLDAPEHGPESSPLRRFVDAARRRMPRIGPMIVIVVLVGVLDLAHVRTYTVVSPLDEQAHIDHVIRGSRGQVLVQPDDKILQEAIREITCRSSEFYPYPPCRERPYRPEEIVWRGYDATAGHPPYYYLLTGLGARVLRAPPLGPESLVTWARILSSVWLLLGLYLAFRAGELLRIPRLPLTLALVFIAATPGLLLTATTLNTDATAAFGGAAVLLAALAWERGRVPLWLLGVAAAACASFDSANAVGVMVVVVYFAVRAATRNSDGADAEDAGLPVKRYLVAGAVVAIGAVVAVASWDLVYGLLRNDVDLSEAPQIKTFKVDSLDIAHVIGKDTIFGVFPPTYGYIPPVMSTVYYILFQQAAAVLAGGALFAAVWRQRLGERVSALGLATLATLLTVPTLYVIYNFVMDSVYFQISTRYAFAAMPALALVLASAARSRLGLFVLGGVTAGLYGAALVELV